MECASALSTVDYMPSNGDSRESAYAVECMPGLEASRDQFGIKAFDKKQTRIHSRVYSTPIYPLTSYIFNAFCVAYFAELLGNLYLLKLFLI